MSPSPDDIPMTAEGQRAAQVGKLDLKEAAAEIKKAMGDGGFKGGCFGPSPRDAWGALEVAGLRAQIAELTERADTQKLLIEEIVNAMQSMTDTLEGLADLAAIYKWRLDRLDKRPGRDTDNLSYTERTRPIESGRTDRT